MAATPLRKPRANYTITLYNYIIPNLFTDDDLNNVVHWFINKNMVLMAAILETKVDGLKLHLNIFLLFCVVLLWFCSKLNITVII